MTKSRKNIQTVENLDLKGIATYHVGRLESASHRSLRAYKDSCLKKYGLSAMQWYIIGAIYDTGNKGMRITDLSNHLGTTLGFMTNSVNLLESKKIVVRSDSTVDSRAKIVMIKESYKKTCRVIERDLRDHLRKTIYNELTREELKAYIKTLQILTSLDK